MNARQIAADVNLGRASARECAEAALGRIARASAMNAIVTMDVERTMAAADAVDQRIRSGQALPLAGVPVVVKDNIWVEGWRVTQGSRLFGDFVAPRSAIAVERLQSAGAVIVGIGATSEFACKGVTTSPLFGPTRHPLDPALTPGGSSGGPAVAVAAGPAPLALGTDAGGSSRRPPAHVGVVGFKPSYGAIPYGPGFAEPCHGVSVMAPIGGCVDDVRLAFAALAGPDARDPESIVLSQPRKAPRDSRIAWSPRLGLDVAVDDEVAQGLDAAVERLRRAGFDIEDRDPVWPAAATEDAIMPLQHAGLAALYGEAFRREPGLFDSDIGKQIESGLARSGVDVARALDASRQIAFAFGVFFRDVDILLAPTVPCAAWPLDLPGPPMIGGRPATPRAHAVFTPFVNHARIPAISVPCGRTAQGLPFGMQIIAARGQDLSLLEFAAAVEAGVRVEPEFGRRRES